MCAYSTSAASTTANLTGLGDVGYPCCSSLLAAAATAQAFCRLSMPREWVALGGVGSGGRLDVLLVVPVTPVSRAEVLVSRTATRSRTARIRLLLDPSLLPSRDTLAPPSAPPPRPSPPLVERPVTGVWSLLLAPALLPSVAPPGWF